MPAVRPSTFSPSISPFESTCSVARVALLATLVAISVSEVNTGSSGKLMSEALWAAPEAGSVTVGVGARTFNSPVSDAPKALPATVSGPLAALAALDPNRAKDPAVDPSATITTPRGRRNLERGGASLFDLEIDMTILTFSSDISDRLGTLLMRPTTFVTSSSPERAERRRGRLDD